MPFSVHSGLLRLLPGEIGNDSINSCRAEVKETSDGNFTGTKFPADSSLRWPERLIDKLNLAASHQQAFSRAEKVSPKM